MKTILIAILRLQLAQKKNGLNQILHVLRQIAIKKVVKKVMVLTDLALKQDIVDCAPRPFEQQLGNKANNIDYNNACTDFLEAI